MKTVYDPETVNLRKVFPKSKLPGTYLASGNYETPIVTNPNLSKIAKLSIKNPDLGDPGINKNQFYVKIDPI